MAQGTLKLLWSSATSELIRTVHLYRSESKVVVVEREFVFYKDKDYQEIINLSNNNSFNVCCYFQGLVNGVWLCIFVFDCSSPNTLLTLSRNPKLQTIPSLTCHIQTITHFTSSHITHHMSHLDLNSLPQGLSQTYTDVSWKKKKRAATKDIASLALEDLAKYFDLPIIQASKNLKVGLTVLKKKCREFGIPRWPHRKIKSLDALISDLQEEVKRQQEEDEGAALAVAERQKMIESEKERIEKKPSMDLQRETKKFRQDVFKKRHRARVLENQCRTLPLF